MKDKIQKITEDHISVVESFGDLYADTLERISRNISKKLKNKKKALIAGNGGLATSAQHFAGELVGRFEAEKKPLAAISLTSDTSVITAIANDYGFDSVFSKQVDALGNKGDVLIVMSASGSSRNILNAIQIAYEKGIEVIFFTGQKVEDINYLYGKKLESLVNELVVVPSYNTARIQETIMLALHIIAGLIEDQFVENQ